MKRIKRNQVKGRPRTFIPGEETNLNVRCSNAEKQKIKQVALDEGTTYSQIIRDFIETLKVANHG